MTAFVHDVFADSRLTDLETVSVIVGRDWELDPFGFCEIAGFKTSTGFPGPYLSSRTPRVCLRLAARYACYLPGILSLSSARP